MRIISGQFKGRTLLSPPDMATRPITDKVKLALFNILGDITDTVVCDLFCGTGSLGLEALSRGAARCGFADVDGRAIALLRKNVEVLQVADRCRIWQGDVLIRLESWLEELCGPGGASTGSAGAAPGGQVPATPGRLVDIAFVDPPYSLVEAWPWEQAVAGIFAPLARRLAADGLVVLRCRRGTPVPEAVGPLRVRQRREYGKMSVVLFSRAP